MSMFFDQAKHGKFQLNDSKQLQYHKRNENCFHGTCCAKEATQMESNVTAVSYRSMCVWGRS
jgi:hypothetical protein